MFIDSAKIHVKGGDGGNGVTAFRREKFVPRGGPSGGDGGDGGSVYIESTEGMNTLLHFRYNPEHRAGRGRHGEGGKRHGARGEDITLQTPVGTVAGLPAEAWRRENVTIYVFEAQVFSEKKSV